MDPRRNAPAEFTSWLATQHVRVCRLVQYDGPDHVAKDVPLHAAAEELAGIVDEGFMVDWAIHGDRVYLKVWEDGRGEPPWAAVFAERDLDGS